MEVAERLPDRPLDVLATGAQREPSPEKGVDESTTARRPCSLLDKGRTRMATLMEFAAIQLSFPE